MRLSLAALLLCHVHATGIRVFSQHNALLHIVVLGCSDAIFVYSNEFDIIRIEIASNIHIIHNYPNLSLIIISKPRQAGGDTQPTLSAQQFPPSTMWSHM
eukprot:COSAG01_NODE_27_length_36706_cov_155.674106_11_plen_100_part_00